MPKPNLVINSVASTLLMVAALVAAMCWSPAPSFNNPFVFMVGYFLVSCTVQLFSFELLDWTVRREGADFVSNLILGPLKLMTVVLIFTLCHSEGYVFLNALVTVVLFWFSYSGFRETFFAVSTLKRKAKEQQDFTNEMKEVAESARTEKAVVADLDAFLASLYPQEKENE